MEDRLQDHPIRPFPKLIINVALTGVVPTKSDNPNVPITPQEIADDALACAREGASIVHVHARDEDGKPTYRKEIYAEIIGRIRDKDPHLVICASTSGRVHNKPELRSEVLSLQGEERPDMASLTLGSFNFPDTISANPPETVVHLASLMRQRGIKPELEVFEAGMINYGVYLMRKGILSNDDRPYFNLILGSLGSARANISSLSHMSGCLPHNAIWSVGGVGRFQLTMTAVAIAIGAGVRVGLEDNIYFDHGKKILATNPQLVRRAAKLAGELGRDVACPVETRQMLGLEIR